ncbi:Mucin-2 [Fusarium oxysporum f. sp. albedinis]|nr:Mucin-2 [Fusarium oxysporum f. sp. albedinis]
MAFYYGIPTLDGLRSIVLVGITASLSATSTSISHVELPAFSGKVGTSSPETDVTTVSMLTDLLPSARKPSSTSDTRRKRAQPWIVGSDRGPRVRLGAV